MIENIIMILIIVLCLLYLCTSIINKIIYNIKNKMRQKHFEKIKEKYKDYFDLDDKCKYLNEEIAMLKNKIADLQLSIRKNLDALHYLTPEDEENAKQKNLEYKYKIKEIKTVLQEKEQEFEDLVKRREAFKQRISEQENFYHWK